MATNENIQATRVDGQTVITVQKGESALTVHLTPAEKAKLIAALMLA